MKGVDVEARAGVGNTEFEESDALQDFTELWSNFLRAKLEFVVGRLNKPALH